MSGKNPPQRGPVRHHGYRPNGNYTKVSNEFLRASELSPAAHRVVAFLLSHNDGYPVSTDVIAAGTGMSRSTVLRAVQAAQEARWLVTRDVWREGAKNRSYQCYITTSHRLSEEEFAELSGREFLPRKPSPSASEHDRKPDLDRCQNDTSPEGDRCQNDTSPGVDRCQNDTSTGVKMTPVPVSKWHHVEDQEEDQLEDHSLAAATREREAQDSPDSSPPTTGLEAAEPKADIQPSIASDGDSPNVQPSAQSVAAEILMETIGAQRLRNLGEDGRRLRKLVTEQVEAGVSRDTIALAVQLWDARPDARPGLLPHLLSDAERQLRPAAEPMPYSTADRRVAEAQALKDMPAHSREVRRAWGLVGSLATKPPATAYERKKAIARDVFLNLGDSPSGGESHLAGLFGAVFDQPALERGDVVDAEIVEDPS